VTGGSKAKAEADSSASLRNDKQKGRANGKGNCKDSWLVDGFARATAKAWWLVDGFDPTLRDETAKDGAPDLLWLVEEGKDRSRFLRFAAE
jgi:hypothetical protein